MWRGVKDPAGDYDDPENSDSRGLKGRRSGGVGEGPPDKKEWGPQERGSAMDRTVPQQRACGNSLPSLSAWNPLTSSLGEASLLGSRAGRGESRGRANRIIWKAVSDTNSVLFFIK